MRVDVRPHNRLDMWPIEGPLTFARSARTYRWLAGRYWEATEAIRKPAD